MFLSNSDMVDLVDLRHRLHRRPEISGEERETAATIVAFIEPTQPDRIVTGLGGHGVAAIYEGAEPGPTVMIRAELDALPIEELSSSDHRSEIPGKGHLCGHDGHMTILAGLARGLHRNPPRRGRAILLFQPAEETGAGAAAVIADPKFAAIAPDYAFSLHNRPGVPVGHARISEGAANCASRGIRIVLTGETSHASTPEHGRSPAPAIATLIPALTALGPGGPLDEHFRLVTVTHVEIGEPAFGIAPGHGELWATLRTVNDAQMGALCAAAEALVREAAEANRLTVDMSYHDIFHHCENEPEAVAMLRRAMDEENVPHGPTKPSRGSEDFGLFGCGAKSAMFLLGSGDTAHLHNPDFDFPDDAIGTGARVFMRALRNLLGEAQPA
ncbi:amidohydrolase [Bosea sp. SSUT16]|uniref:Amidohydrolase n=1 Tax=Bosea spartocytisi TaxID=2773451 RepID=A0A927HZ83_9HYPH|nr:amidohydrolase [Bosea spartocytisi]MBD3845201.1 amidohydrolase [Bosea spartocytisi]MCT4472372.1 amidohydrolase [Bosea spartocytisi]